MCAAFVWFEAAKDTCDSHTGFAHCDSPDCPSTQRQIGRRRSSALQPLPASLSTSDEYRSAERNHETDHESHQLKPATRHLSANRIRIASAFCVSTLSALCVCLRRRHRARIIARSNEFRCSVALIQWAQHSLYFFKSPPLQSTECSPDSIRPASRQ